MVSLHYISFTRWAVVKSYRWAWSYGTAEPVLQVATQCARQKVVCWFLGCSHRLLLPIRQSYLEISFLHFSASFSTSFRMPSSSWSYQPQCWILTETVIAECSHFHYNLLLPVPFTFLVKGERYQSLKITWSTAPTPTGSHSLLP